MSTQRELPRTISAKSSRCVVFIAFLLQNSFFFALMDLWIIERKLFICEVQTWQFIDSCCLADFGN